MKRRALLIRTATGTLSASVFTVVGWLMGTRTLTMISVPPDCPGGTQCGSAYVVCAGARPPSQSGYCLYQATKYCCSDGTVQWVGTYCGDHCLYNGNCPPVQPC
jgi:hypothetical protein